MPNWCENDIEIRGPKSDLYKKLADAAEKGEFCNTIVPVPEELREVVANGDARPELVEKYGHSDWYSFSVANWGTKWDPEFDDVDYDDKGFQGDCESAWAPPLDVLESLRKQNPKLDIVCYYYEPGLEFAGKWHNGTDEEISTSDFPTDGSKLTKLQEELDSRFDIIEMLKMFEDE